MRRAALPAAAILALVLALLIALDPFGDGPPGAPDPEGPPAADAPPDVGGLPPPGPGAADGQGRTVVDEAVLGTLCEVRGRVTDKKTGLPVSGARVATERVATEGDGRAVRTDADGRYALTARLLAGSRLSVVASGYARAEKEVPAEGDVDFALLPGTTIRGRVVSVEGWAVEDALVFATSERQALVLEWDIGSAASDSEGRFVLPGLRRDMGTHVLSVFAPGYGQLVREVRTGRGDVNVGTLVLREARAIEGVALDAEGKPLAGAPVSLVALLEHAAPAWDGVTRKGPTDGLGRFRFDGLGPGSYRLVLHQGSTTVARMDVELPAGEDLSGVELRVSPGRTLTIRVEDEQGRPVAGARVSAVGESCTVKGRTGADGAAVLEHAPAETVTAWARVKPTDGVERYLPAEPVRVGPGETEVRFVLRAAARITGVVLDAEGKPLPRMRVMVMDPEGGQLPHGGTADESGAFSLTVPAGQVVDLLVNGSRATEGGGSGYEITKYRGEAKGVRAPAEGVEIRCAEMKPTEALTVLVLDVEGKPVGGAVVGVGSRLGYVTKEADAEGRAPFNGLPPEKVTVRMQRYPRESFPEDVLAPSTRVVPEGQEVVLRFKRGRFVTGTAKLPDGEPAAGAFVSLRTADGDDRTGRTDTDGRFRVAVEAGVEHHLFVLFQSKSGRAFQGLRAGVVAGDVDVVVELVPR